MIIWGSNESRTADNQQDKFKRVSTEPFSTEIVFFERGIVQGPLVGVSCQVYS